MKNKLNQCRSSAFSLTAELYLFTKQLWNLVITFGLCLLCGFSLPTAAQKCATVPNGAVGWWPLNEQNGATSINELIFGNSGVPMSAPVGSTNAPSPTSGMVNGALYFYQKTTYVRVPNNPVYNFGTSDFTIDAWVKPVQVGPALFQPIVEKASPTGLPGGVQGYRLYIKNASLLFALYDGNTSALVASPPGSISFGAWQFVAAERAGNALNLYVNGNLVATATLPAGFGSISNNADLLIGGITGFTPAPFQTVQIGEIALDEVEIFKRALTQAEIQAIYNAGSAGKCKPKPKPCTQPPSGMVAWWPFDGGANDIVGNNNPSATNAISYVPAKVAQGVKFGTGGYIDIPHSASLANQKFTIDAWVMPLGPGPNNDFLGSVIVQKGFSNTVVSPSLWWSANPQNLHKFIFGFGNISTERIVSASSFPPGKFYHVAATYDGKVFKLYVNGVLQGQTTLVKTMSYNPTIPWTIGSTAAPFRSIGFSRTFNGVIDEVEIFNRALSQSEIQSIYNAGPAGKCRFKVIGPPNNPTN